MPYGFASHLLTFGRVKRDQNLGQIDGAADVPQREKAEQSGCEPFLTRFRKESADAEDPQRRSRGQGGQKIASTFEKENIE